MMILSTGKGGPSVGEEKKFNKALHTEHLPALFSVLQRFVFTSFQATFSLGKCLVNSSLGGVDICSEDSVMNSTWLTFVEGATCMYSITSDRDFLIGPHPRHPNVLVGAGFLGHGFKFSTRIGKILAALALDGTTSQPIERFRLDRLT